MRERFPFRERFSEPVQIPPPLQGEARSGRVPALTLPHRGRGYIDGLPRFVHYSEKCFSTILNRFSDSVLARILHKITAWKDAVTLRGIFSVRHRFRLPMPRRKPSGEIERGQAQQDECVGVRVCAERQHRVQVEGRQLKQGQRRVGEG